MSDIFCSLRQLSVTYRRDKNNAAAALDRIDLDIAAGERLAIIGESGSGKSTLARALAGLLPEEARIEGKISWPALGHAPAPGRDFGFVFQDPGTSLNPVLAIGEQVAEGARQHLGLGWRQAFARAEAAFTAADPTAPNVLLAQGYGALARKAQPQSRAQGAALLDDIIDRLRLAGSKEAAFFAGQLVTADALLLGAQRPGT